MICRWYLELVNKFPDIDCDAFVCMPNHVHFVVVNVGADLCVRPNAHPGDHPNAHPNAHPDVHPDVHPDAHPDVHPDVHSDVHSGNDDGQTHRSAPTGAHTILGEHAGSPLHRVVQWFKTMSTNEYIRGVKQNGWAPFPGKLWQRNYWEHIVRNEPELNRIREYIHNNPAQWELDKLFVRADLRVRPRPGPNSTEIRESIIEYNVEAWMV